MANTYSQLFIHFIFAVQNRSSIINPKWQDELYKYMNSIVTNHEHKLYCVNGMPDHLHLLVSMNPKQAPSDLMYHIKRSTSLWINEKELVPGKFSWQEGFGAFSVGKTQVKDKISYIENQQVHHRLKTFREEYLMFLKEYEVDYDDRFIFKPIDERK